MKYLFLFIGAVMNQLRQINKTYKLYPQWLKKKSDGSLIPCKQDEDCPFPAACCNEPFFPAEFCCYGWNQRKMQYAYIYNYVKSD
jgi:hypothetical protein